MKMKESSLTVSKRDFAFLEIAGITSESVRVKSFKFNARLAAEPGQFVMIWIPRVDAKPFGIMSCDAKNESFEITIARVGAFTDKLFNLKQGDRLGVQGPFGNSFTLPAKAKSVALIAGGFGAAPLAFLAQRCAERGVKATFFEGAKNAGDVILEKRLRSLAADFRVATDDGSCGFKGYCTQFFEEALKNEKFDAVFTCGPELMMKRVVETCCAKKIPVQFSLERFMKCGYGVCGQCACGSKLVCKDGTVFTQNDLPSLSDFSVTRRDASGAKTRL